MVDLLASETREGAVGGSIFQRITRQAIWEPGRMAIADKTSTLTYGELDASSNRLAAMLIARGTAREHCVGIFMNRSTAFVIAALAVQKAGAAYLPLDPSLPEDRVSFILADAGAVLVLAEASTASDLPEGPWDVVALDDMVVDQGSDGPSGAESMRLAPEDLAYVIYTSGSTGRPKGVEITHANLNNLISWHVEAFGISADDRTSHVAGIGFDAAVWEIWPTLSVGASLHIADQPTSRSAPLLHDWLVEERITVAFVPTALAEQLIHTSWPAGTALRTMLTGADTLTRRPGPGLPFTLVNNYGPTECAVVATSGPVRADRDAGRPSIGRPITGARGIVVHDNLRPVADGEVGELCLAGALVGRGYRNNPELTAERFVLIDAGDGEYVRAYRTGDQVRRLVVGDYEFLGRLDDQVKVRGNRVEIGEVVACLNAVPGVDASTVAVWHINEVGELAGGGGSATAHLVGYVVPAADARVCDGDLREFLGARLPDYMVPASFVSIPALPLTPNGKIDKAQLPAPSTANELPARSPGAGRPIEAQIAELVASLLDRPSVGADENFFLSGGHSMLGTQLVLRIRQTFGVRMTLRQLFGSPTVAGLAAVVEQAAGCGRLEAGHR